MPAIVLLKYGKKSTPSTIKYIVKIYLWIKYFGMNIIINNPIKDGPRNTNCLKNELLKISELWWTEILNKEINPMDVRTILAIMIVKGLLEKRFPLTANIKEF